MKRSLKGLIQACHRVLKRNLFFFFIDGIGLGRPSPDNPFTRCLLPAWRRLANEGYLVPTDACLGVPGLPQSATGQTALYTGVNAPGVLGRHLTGQPSPTLVRLLQEDNLFLAARRRGLRATLLNALKPEFFVWYRPGEIGTPAARKRPFPGVRRFRPWAGIVAADAAGLRFRSLEDLAQGRAVAHDIDGRSMPAGKSGPVRIEPEEAGRIAAAVAAEHDLTLYEHFRTDPIGHQGDIDAAVEALERIDRFLSGLLEGLDPARTLLLITSDHGNMENCSEQRHTRNPVGTYLWGAGAREAATRIRDLTDIMPAVLAYLDEPGGRGPAAASAKAPNR